MHGMNIAEAYIILSFYYRPLQFPLQSIMIFDQTATFRRLHLSASFLFGFTMVFVGSSIRVLCFRHLGRFFTFELSLRKQHKLITDGPYSVVRHPSYTGSIIFLTGLVICQMGTGSWWAEFGLWNTGFGKIVGGLWISHVLLLEYQLIVRTGKEDRVLKEAFSTQWEDWAARTPYKLLLGVY